MSTIALQKAGIATERGREFWRGEHQARIPDELASALRRVAQELGLSLSSVLLTAHAKVLDVLSGEHQMTSGSWREALLESARGEARLLSHKMSVDFLEHDNLVLRLRYRTDLLDADRAARIAGYHLTALGLIAGDPAAEHERQSLLSADELHFQLESLAGPRRELPNRRVHELFEERVRAHPDAVAAVHRDRQWTYRQLNGRANQLARALLARGLRREDVVAVVTERNLDWMAAVLAIFKAGGAYLPIEPHFPADRIARTLSRAGCPLVLTELGSTARHRRRARPARVHLLHLRFHR